MDNEFRIRIKGKLIRELGKTITETFENPNVVEVMLNPDGRVWVEELGTNMKVLCQMGASQAEAFISTLASYLDTIIDQDNPTLEGEFPIGHSRIACAIPPVVKAPIFSLRRSASQVFPLNEYVTQGILSEIQCQVISSSVRNRKNILVVGGTGSGKTTFANALIREISEIHPEHRLLIIEDTLEIQCRAENAVAFRTSDTITMAHILKHTLRHRPDRIIVGEVRGGEALTLLKAWNTGHPGGVSTIHANNAHAGLIRLEQLVSEVSEKNMASLIGDAIDLIITISKSRKGRSINEILYVDGYENGNYKTHEWDNNYDRSTLDE